MPRLTLILTFLLISYAVTATESARELFKFAKFSFEDGEYQKAISYVNQAIAIESTYSSAYVLRAEIYLKLGNYKLAIEDASRIIDTEATTSALTSNSYLLRGAAYFYLNQYRAALTDLAACVNVEPENARAYYFTGLIHINNTVLFPALENFDNAIKYDQQQGEYYYFRAKVKSDLFKPIPGTVTYNEIMDDIQSAQNLNAADYRSYDLKCKMLRLNAEHQKEIYLAELDKTIELFPDQSEFYGQRGMAQVLDYKFVAALEDFSMAMKLGGPDESLLRNRALCYHNLGQYHNALKDYNESIELMIKVFQATDDKSTKNKLAETLVMRGRTFEAAGQPDNACDDFYNAAKLGSKNGLNNYRRNCNVYQ